jgi:hypothetical protein
MILSPPPDARPGQIPVILARVGDVPATHLPEEAFKRPRGRNLAPPLPKLFLLDAPYLSLPGHHRREGPNAPTAGSSAVGANGCWPVTSGQLRR